jgi:hypothetical protein
MVDVGSFYCHFVYFTAKWSKWYILWHFGHLFSPRFGMLYREKFGNPGWWTRPRWPVMDIFRRFREYLL